MTINHLAKGAEKEFHATIMDRARILLADDHAILLDALKRLLEPVYQVVGAVTDGQTLIDVAVRLRPDVFLIDIAMPRLNGLDACERIKMLLPNARVIFLTMNEDADTAAEAIRRGASGYLMKKSPSSELLIGIQTVLKGGVYVASIFSHGMTSLFVAQAEAKETARKLTFRQREVLQLIAEGRSMKEAAGILNVTPRTIAFHKYSIMEHLGIRTTAELVRYAVQLGMVADSSTPPAALANRHQRARA
jgi:DNA-binding NarL/FixJ family response regulator